eukprot:364314-Chlamydomonas_euryale.AAC.18
MAPHACKACTTYARPGPIASSKTHGTHPPQQPPDSHEETLGRPSRFCATYGGRAVWSSSYVGSSWSRSCTCACVVACYCLP